MLKFLLGLFINLHGLVHFWYVTLSQRWVEFQADMGWTGRSLLLSNSVQDTALRPAASVLYTLPAIGFVIGGIGIFLEGDWVRPLLAGTAILSSVVILRFWDGSLSMLVQKGLLGLLINTGILVAILFRT